VGRDRTSDEIADLTVFTHAAMSAIAKVELERRAGPAAGQYKLDGARVVAIFARSLRAAGTAGFDSHLAVRSEFG
jgi:hypothetical protein